MACVLIERLNKLSTLTPDQIANRIRPLALIKCAELTEPQWLDLANVPIYYYNYRNQTWEGHRTIPITRKVVNLPSRTFERFHSNFSNSTWALMRVEDYSEHIGCPLLID